MAPLQWQKSFLDYLFAFKRVEANKGQNSFFKLISYGTQVLARHVVLLEYQKM